MIELGKNIFKVNATQLFTIIFCFGLAFIAKYFSMGIANLTVSEFISMSFNNIFSSNEEEYSIFLNVLLPAIFYVVSCILLLWVGITNFFTIMMEEYKVDRILKSILGIFQIILCSYFLIIGGKLILKLVAFTLVSIIIVAFITSSLNSSTRNSY
jgi:hypothetical protein